MLSDDSSSGPLFTGEVRGVATDCHDASCEEGDEDSENEIEIFNTRRTDYVAIDVEKSGKLLESL